MSIGSDTQISSQNVDAQTQNRKLSAVALSENKVFVAYVYSTRLYGTVCTIENSTITMNTNIQLATTSIAVSVVALSANKVFVAYSYRDYLCTIVCEINETEIIAGKTNETIVFNKNTISAVALSANKVFVAYDTSNNYYLYATICSIEGDTVTFGQLTQLSTESYSGYVISPVKLSENKIFIAHRGDTAYLYGIVCIVSGEVITAGQRTQLCTDKYAGQVISATALNKDKIFITHQYSQYNRLCATICTIAETTINVEVTTVLSNVTGSGYIISTATLSKNKVFIVYSYNTDYLLYSMICTIKDNAITVSMNTELKNEKNAGNIILATLLHKNKIFIAHIDSSTYLYGMLFNLNEYIQQLTTSTDDIYGIAKTNGTEGDMVDIYRPEEVAV